MSQISINWSHRLGKRKGPGQKPRTIIVKYTLHDLKISTISIEIKEIERKRYFCYRKRYTEKDGTPQESERTTWFCKCLDIV